MKLIIEIPEEQYNDIVKYLTNNDGNYAYSDFNLREIIRNGTPYNPSGDAISREALKKEFDKEYQCDCSVCEHSRFDSFKGYYHCGIIDNAPTVDLWQMRQEATENALKKAEVLYERPQGEWIGDTDFGDTCKCSNCKQVFDTDRLKMVMCDGKYELPPSCPNCGADMRTKGGE